MEGSCGDSHRRSLFRVGSSSLERAVGRGLFTSGDPPSSATVRGQRGEKRTLFGSSRYHIDESRLSARTFHGWRQTTSSERPYTYAFCASWNCPFHWTDSPLEYSEHMVHLRDTGPADSGVHCTILRRHHQVVAGRIDADS